MKDFKLDDHPKIKPGFRTPEGYFDSLSKNVMAQIEQEKTKVIPFYARTRNWFMAAAAVLVFALMIPFLQRDTAIDKNLDDAAIEDYLSYQSNITQYDLVNLLENEDVDKLEADFPIEDETIEDILVSNNNFQNYIID